MPEERKLVTVLFADVVGSTEFGSENDPEVVRSVMTSYFARMKEIAETHGGTVEKFIGDAVMVVFGVPRQHDDDAERAVRAAFAMRAAMDGLNRELAVSLGARIGVNSGQAVTGAAEERQFLVTGDAVNVGARLQQGADVGEIVVGALTEQLSRQAIEYRTREPVAAKGKVEPITAFTAVRARSAVPEQARGLPALRAQLVGRQAELSLLLDTFTRTRDERRAHLFTVVGAAGVGKSRLVGEALARFSGSNAGRVLRGRCLPYGTGITYWPFIEVVRTDAAIAYEDTRGEALAKLARRVSELVAADADRRSLAARLGAMLGLQPLDVAMPEVEAARVPAELAWGMRRYVDALARSGPTILVIDDLQWGEAPLVEAVEQIAERVREAPLLLLCVARPELLDSRPSWGRGMANATLITLEPLTRDETTTLIGRLLDVDELPSRLRAEIVERSEGNPLFCEEFLRVLIDDGTVVREDMRWRATAAAALVHVPESIQAVLGARLDGLAPDERRAMQVASVMGERFDARQVAALDAGVPAEAFDRLVRKGLVLENPEASEATGLKFKHLLVRDAAYASLPKADRAELHARFGETLEREVGDRRDEFAEILAHHAERAFAIGLELRLPAAVIRPRAERALSWAIPLAERARARNDLGTFARFVDAAERAASAAGLDVHDPRAAQVAVLRVEQLIEAGSYAELNATYRAAADRALAAERPDLAARAHLARLRGVAWAGGDAEIAQFEAESLETRELFGRANDEGGVLELELLGLDRLWTVGRLGEMLALGDTLHSRALTSGDKLRAARIAGRLIGAALWSGRRDELERYVGQAEQLTAELRLTPQPWHLQMRPRLLWFGGDEVKAESLYRENIALAEEWGWSQLLIGQLRSQAELYIDIERYEALDEAASRALAESERTGERWNRTELIAMRGLAATKRGDLDVAEEFIREARATLRAKDVSAETLTDSCLAQLRIAQGRDDEAEALLRRALEETRKTDYHVAAGINAVELAEFLARRGRGAEAKTLLDEAERVFDSAGFILRRRARERVRALLATGVA
jgi:predicted ATPase/class 3 adenylate cyclase